jgi:heme-degrading monooxygenase HmoA
MIVRVYRCSVVAGKDAEFRAYAASKSHPRLREHPGLVAFYASRPLPGSDHRRRCMVQIWESEAALEAALGSGWREVPPLPGEAQSFIEDASVEHYELADAFRSSLYSDLPTM